METEFAVRVLHQRLLHFEQLLYAYRNILTGSLLCQRQIIAEMPRLGFQQRQIEFLQFLIEVRGNAGKTLTRTGLDNRTADQGIDQATRLGTTDLFA